MSTKHTHISRKIFLIGIPILMAILIFVGNQFASANALLKEQKATKSFSERAQAELDDYKSFVDKEKDPTKKAELEKGLRLKIMQATQISVAETEVPTNWAFKQTDMAKPTEKKTPEPTRVRVFGYEDFTNIYLDRNLDMALGAWFDREPNRTDQAAIVYFSGVMRKSKYGVVMRFYEDPAKIEEFVVGEETGKIKIIGREGDFLVLREQNGDPLYFNVMTNEFTHALEGTITPIPSLSPTETLQAYP